MNTLTHLNARGEVHMVDVGEKAVTTRVARASGRIRMQASTLAAVLEGRHPKGDVLAVARVAAIMAAKRTSELIPLCHPVPLDGLEVSCEADENLPGIRIEARARTASRTGVEMEALTAVQVGLLTVYDMCKALDRGMVIEAVQLLEKSGGRSGHWQAEPVGPSTPSTPAGP
jgi:cyclic pyranopterin monophosphate synthase